MKKLLFPLLFLLSQTALSQTEVIDILQTLYEEQNVEMNGIQRIEIKSYQTFSWQDVDPDSTLVMANGDSIELYLQSSSIRERLDKNHATETHLNAEGELSYVSKFTTEDSGLVISEDADFGDGPMGDMMSSVKTLVRDNEGRIREIIVEKDGVANSVLGASYLENGFLSDLTMNLGMMMVGISSKVENDTIYHESEMELAAEFKEMMGDKNLEDDKVRMKSFKEGKLWRTLFYKGGDPVLTNSILMDNKFVIRENISYDPSGEIINHMVYNYSKENKLRLILDKMSMTEKSIDYDDRGNPLVEYVDFSVLQHEYDDKGNIIKTITRAESVDGEITAIELRKIFYEE